MHPVPLTSLTVEALKDFDVSRKDAERAKNMFALGLLSWLYNRPTEATEAFLERKFAKSPTAGAVQPHRVQRRLELRRDDRGVHGPLRGQAGARCRRAATATSPATSRCPTV